MFPLEFFYVYIIFSSFILYNITKKVIVYIFAIKQKQKQPINISKVYEFKREYQIKSKKICLDYNSNHTVIHIP